MQKRCLEMQKMKYSLVQEVLGKICSSSVCAYCCADSVGSTHNETNAVSPGGKGQECIPVFIKQPLILQGRVGGN